MTNLEELIKKRNDFIEKFPHMKEFQKYIDNFLNKVPEKNRFEVLLLLIIGKNEELERQLNKIQKEIIK